MQILKVVGAVIVILAFVWVTARSPLSAGSPDTLPPARSVTNLPVDVTVSYDDLDEQHSVISPVGPTKAPIETVSSKEAKEIFRTAFDQELMGRFTYSGGERRAVIALTNWKLSSCESHFVGIVAIYGSGDATCDISITATVSFPNGPTEVLEFASGPVKTPFPSQFGLSYKVKQIDPLAIGNAVKVAVGKLLNQISADPRFLKSHARGKLGK